LQRGLDHPGNGRGHLVLEVENISERTVKAVGPQMRAGNRVDQLPGDPDPVPCFAHRAFEDIADSKLAADPLYIDGLPFVGEARFPGDDEEPADAAERGDDL